MSDDVSTAGLTAGPNYYAPHGGLSPQTDILSRRTVFTEAYAMIPRDVMQDIVTSALPFRNKMRAWILARPLIGFAEAFSQSIIEVGLGGGSEQPEPAHDAEGVLLMLEGKAVYRLNRDWVEVKAGDFMWLRAFCPQACYTGGPSPFCYLLYKDVNRHPRLRLGGA